MNEAKPCIQIINLQIDLSDQPVYRNLNLQIDSGTLAAIVGQNSAAWNILMRMLAGMSAFRVGQIELWGVPISQIGRRGLNSLIGYVPRLQQPFFAYPVMEFIMQGCEVNLKPMQAPQACDYEKANQLMRQLKIERLAKRDCSLLNHAERELVLLARALMQDARLLLLDDPVASLSESEQFTIITLLRDMAHQQGKTILLSLADPWLALQLADQLVIFDDQSIASVLYRQQPDFADAAEYVLRRLLPLDQDCHLLDPLGDFGKPARAGEGYAAEQTGKDPGKPAKSGFLF